MTFMTTLRDINRIEELIPQRSPIIMVDELLEVVGDECKCRLTIREENYFLEKDKTIAEGGVIEHIAQSASAFAGYRAIMEGAVKPPIGYIGEVKNFHLKRRPKLGDVLDTTICMGATVGGVTIITATTLAGQETIAETQMKIFIRKD